MTLTRAARCALLAWLALAACSDRGAAPPTPTPTRAPRPTPTQPVGLLPSPTPEATPLPTPTVPPPAEANAQHLVQSFLDAPYRVVAVAKSPFAPYSLIVANERAPAECGSPERPQRCTDDETCGSLYSAPTCFFFVEPSFDAAADAATRYVARWPEVPALSALVTDSLRFIDGRTVEFRAAGGDADHSVQEVWWLDLVTGALALQSRVEG